MNTLPHKLSLYCVPFLVLPRKSSLLLMVPFLAFGLQRRQHVAHFQYVPRWLEDLDHLLR